MKEHRFHPPHRSSFTLFFLLAFFGCSHEKNSAIHYPSTHPPGRVAELFAPGIISTHANEHSAIALSPDGKLVLWAVMDSLYRGRLLEMHYSNGTWSTPATPTFVDTTADHYAPNFSVDGKTLYFSSRRKASGYREGRGNRIWAVERTSDGWEISFPIDSTVSKAEEYSHSITSNGTLYFSSPGVGTSLDILKAEKKYGRYTVPTPLPYNINSAGYEDGPYISPQEDYLIFESTRPEGIAGSHDLYISFRHSNGDWAVPLNMGPKINSAGMERFPRVSPDGKYLFFASNKNQSPGHVGFDIYWIDAKVIDELRTTAAENKIIAQPLGDDILTALHNGDSSRCEMLLKQWLTSYSNSLDAVVMYSSMLRKWKRFPEAEQLLAGIHPPAHENTAITMETALVKYGRNNEEEARRLLSPLLIEGSPDLRHRYLVLANALFDMKKFDPSDEYFEKAMAEQANGVEYYNRACSYAKIGEKDRSFKKLNQAADHGFNSKQQYENDADLTSLKSDERFGQLRKKLR